MNVDFRIWTGAAVVHTDPEELKPTAMCMYLDCDVNLNSQPVIIIIMIRISTTWIWAIWLVSEDPRAACLLVRREAWERD